MKERSKDYTRRTFFQLLRSNGYKEVRNSGSHHIFTNSNGDTISVNKDPNRMVIRRLIKEHNLKERR